MIPKSGLLILLMIVPAHLSQGEPAPAAKPTDDHELNYHIERITATKGFDGNKCWVHARAGSIPPHSPGNATDQPIVVMTMQPLLLSGSDVFYALHAMRTDDQGRTWDGPLRQETLRRREFPEGGTIVVSDFWPKWHAPSGKLLGTGHTVRYIENRIVPGKNPRVTAYAVYDPQERTWSDWRTLELPKGPQFLSSGAGSTQRYDLPNGDVLLPVYFEHPDKKDIVPAKMSLSSMVLRCRFDGGKLSYVEHGNEMWLNFGRGLSEPSLTKYGDWFYLTLRNDEFAYVTRSRDGLHFQELRKWTFDDGKDLGSYNTQAHWVTHSEGLFLVYTRRGANNDHVMRHRAPLFIAQVDPQRMAVIRSSERVLVPQRGARLGNFGVTDVGPSETWVVVSEWMQTRGPNFIIPVDNKYGADNSVFVSKIKWNRPNSLAERISR